VIGQKQKEFYLKKQTTFSAASRLLFEWSISHYTLINYYACATSSIRLVMIGQLRKALFVKNIEPSLLQHTFYSRAIPQTTNPSFTAHVPQLISVLLRSVKNKGHFTGRTNYCLHCITQSIWRIYLKLQLSHLLRMRHNYNIFGCDRSITMGTILKEQNTFPTVSRLLFERSISNFTPITYYACATILISLVTIGQ